MKGQEKIILELSDFEISYEPIETEFSKQIPDHLSEEVGVLNELLTTAPQTALKKIEKVLRAYPDLAIVRNYQVNAYLRLGEKEKAARLAEENYEKFPEYLFSRINYAMMFLEKGETNRIPAIFDYQFDLTRIYPKRRIFHISEYLSFMGVISLYHSQLGENRIAKRYYKIMKKADPTHPLTRRVKRFISPFTRFLMKYFVGR
jgi:tetratricopeptide (TPR) repeat protein